MLFDQDCRSSISGSQLTANGQANCSCTYHLKKLLACAGSKGLDGDEGSLAYSMAIVGAPQSGRREESQGSLYGQWACQELEGHIKKRVVRRAREHQRLHVGEQCMAEC